MAESYKQPHEDVPRPYGDDPLLSLDESAVPYRDALIAMSKHLGTATLVGNPAPVVQRMYDRLSEPQPGDLVVEQTSQWRKDPDNRLKAFGRLVLRRREWWTTDEEWEARKAEDEDEGLTDADRSTDEAWYIQYGPDHICRWTNCSFRVIPVDITDFAAPAGYRDGNATVFTRDSLLGSLADSGIALHLPVSDSTKEDTDE